jgi:hypothetical protein
MDYRAVVVADGCSDKDPEVQRVLMEKIFPVSVEGCDGRASYRRATVTAD